MRNRQIGEYSFILERTWEVWKMKKAFLISAMFIAASAVGAWADACADGAAGKYGAITIATVDDKCVATLDPDDTTSVNIPNDVTIDEFVYDRDFTAQQVQTSSTNSAATFTFCLPFSGNYQGSNLYRITDIKKNGSQWAIEATQADPSRNSFEAGVPYFVQHSWNSTSVKFTPTTPINTSSLSPTKFGENNEWEFRGTFNYKKWQDGDSQIGHVYGFAASDTTTASGSSFKAGQFVRIKAGAFIKPMRAYLYYNKPATSNAPIPANGNVLAKAAAEEEELPQTIEVIFRDKDGNVMSIAQMNTYTGEVTAVEGWYDLKGRKLNAKPTQKGTYFNNGKKVVIK